MMIDVIATGLLIALFERGVPAAMYGYAPQMFVGDLKCVYRIYGNFSFPRTASSIISLTIFAFSESVSVELAVAFKIMSFVGMATMMVIAVFDVFRARTFR